MNHTDVIAMLQLQPHPEGGYFKETYRSDLMVTPEGRAASRAGVGQLIEGVGLTHGPLPLHALLAHIDEGHVARLIWYSLVLLDAGVEARLFFSLDGHGL